MSETTPETTTTALVPEGKNILRSLTVAELDMASRRVGADINEAVDNEQRYQSLAVLADIWARRAGDPRREDDFRKMEQPELLVLVGLQAEAAAEPDPPAALAGTSGEQPADVDDAAPADEVDPANPTDSEPASN